MGWTQIVDEPVIEVTMPPPVRKKIWNGHEFVSVTLYRKIGNITAEQHDWLIRKFGPPNQYIAGHYWDTSRTGLFTVMDEQVYMWFCLKWSKQ